MQDRIQKQAASIMDGQGKVDTKICSLIGGLDYGLARFRLQGLIRFRAGY